MDDKVMWKFVGRCSIWFLISYSNYFYRLTPGERQDLLTDRRAFNRSVEAHYQIVKRVTHNKKVGLGHRRGYVWKFINEKRVKDVMNLVLEKSVSVELRQNASLLIEFMNANSI